ncbi:helix-turn-helix transcriptional regulator [Nonomuraea roseoviolacea]|uniref:Transcriptional regulator with XRE-family HTH domain n=1 Tax=Nonomuraea roseoviolacea subsp. carminata TaxID=160689 RepID=A0ABT1JZB1_9ACTN|nr:XRE family transcriptional regulator [Nonomuraea roseoviolacea]MCP2347083.1 transcriptional regulator with XRE-family HTH domain [Nonomuraea roseoviolacea subsp. carminata]
MNNNLRYALAAARLTPTDVAAALAVDPKTVARWLQGRTPYPRHRWAIADLLHIDEVELWPETDQRHRVFADGVEAVYPHRWSVPQRMWRDLFQGATAEIGILAYSALFIAEDPGLLRVLTDRASAGTKVRILLGNPASSEVAARGNDEGIGSDVMSARIRNALAFYHPLTVGEGIKLRLHRTVLYSSIYRADDDLLVNTHAYATPAADAPVMHLRRTESHGTAATYLTCFERVWTTAEPYRHDC